MQSNRQCANGISNVGNVCYSSSVIQCLFNHPSFRDLCVDQHPQQCFDLIPYYFNFPHVGEAGDVKSPIFSHQETIYIAYEAKKNCT